MNTLNSLGTEVTAIGRLIGLLTGPDDNLTVNTDWFKNPIAQLEQTTDRLNDLVVLLDGILGPAEKIPPPVFQDAQWFPIPNPASGLNTVFHLVTGGNADTSGQFGLGVLYPVQLGRLTIEAFCYAPVFSYGPNGVGFIADGPDNPIQIGLYATSSDKFQIGDVTFTALEIEGSIFLADKTPTFTLSFANLQGAGSQPSTYHSLTALLDATVQTWIGEVIVQGSGFLNSFVGPGRVTQGDIYSNEYATGTVGDFLVAANFLTQDANGDFHLSLQNLQGQSASQIALNFVFAFLDGLAKLNFPVVSLPGGGIYITETENNTAKDYGLRMVVDIPLTSGQNSNGKSAPAIDFCLGTWLTGESAGNNWIERTAGKGASPEPGLSVLFLNRAANGDLSFAPSFVLTSIGLNIKGGAKTPLINHNGYALNGADLRFYLNPEGQLGTPSAWNYGFAIRLDDVGLPLAPSTITSGGGNPVAQNLLSSGSNSGGQQSAGADNAAVNPPFSAAIAWRSDSTNDPKFDFQLFDKNETPTDQVLLPVQRAFGPLQCQRLGIGWQHPNPNLLLAFLFDGDVSLAGLEIDLKGLSAGIPLATPTDVSNYKLDLDGLDFTFAEGSVEISGGLFKTLVALEGQKITEYNGEALIKAGTWSISALGSWATLNGHPSLFIFAFLDATIGGPAFFFITGLSAGFGYNRSLKLPTQNQVATFPLLAGLTDPSQIGGATATPAQALQSLQEWVLPTQGCYWLAAGVQFTTFELVNSNALIVVEFGRHFEIAILGLARARLPQAGPITFAYVELALEIIIDPEDGVVSFTAVLTPNSYVLDPACHLTGGFAFFVWFGSNTHAGDFVITLGGYHPYFKKPSWYPDEPVLGFNWQISDQLSISGGAYFALTPSCVMAGGSLNAQFHAGPLSAWFRAWADFLVQWKPFYFIAEIGIDMGIALKIHLLFVKVTIKIELGADLKLWGPPVGGLVHVHLWIVTVTIGFGPPFGQGNDYLEFGDFQSLLPQDKQNAQPHAALLAAAATPSVPLQNVVKLVVNRGLFPKTNPGGRWLVRSDEFIFSVETAFPLTELNLVGPQGTTPVPPPQLAVKDEDAPACARASDGYYVGVRPMGINCTASTLTLTVTDERNINQDLNTDWLWSVNTRSVPEALWGKAIPHTDTPAAASKLLPGRLVGLQGIAPRIIVPVGPPPIPQQNLSDDPVNPTDENYLPFPQSAQTNQPQASATSLNTIASTLTAAKPSANRQAIFSALANFGYDAGTNGDLSALAANVNLNYPAAPLLGSPVA